MSERDFTHLPQELRQRDQWVAWRWELRDGKPTKVPYDPRTGRHAKPNIPATWTTFATAVAALAHDNGYSGIGYVFSADDPYAGVDLDHCRDAATGVIADWAHEIIGELDSYTEVSPSGTGVHLIVAASMPADGKRTPYQSGGVEMYDAGRYFTMTGQRVDGTPATINARQDELAAVHARVFAARKQRKGAKASASTGQRQHAPASDPPIADDAALIRLASKASNGATFSRLWRGDTSECIGEDGGPDDSRADLALCNLLAFWCGECGGAGDPERIDRLFRQSGLMRPKWERADYRERTIAAALDGRTDWYRGSASGARQSTGSHAAGSDASDGASDTSGGNDGPAPDDAATTAPPAHPYRSTPRGLVRVKTVGRDGDLAEVEELLCNFTATITADIVEDDGVEMRHAFEIAAQLRGRTSTFTVPAERFMGMGWAAEHLGATAILMPGQAIKDHARAAVQLLSGQDMPERRVYQHTGWRQVEGGAWVYLHAGGAIGADGMVPGVSVALDGPLGRYALPAPPQGATLATAIRASLALLDVAPDTVTVPIYAAIWRAALAACGFSVHVVGASGEGKTAIAALAQQHYGTALDAAHLPGSWTSTGNANEALAFAAKDALMVVDDLVSSGTLADQQRLHRDVERLLRAQGNQAGRARLRADASMRPAKAPRGLILSTGEDMLRGHSLIARVLIVEHERGTLAWDRMTACQRDADAGHYAAALAGYVRWLAPQYETVRAGLGAEVVELRERLAAADTHRRTPGIVADLAVGIRHFIHYAQANGAITKAEAGVYLGRAWRALLDVAHQQTRYQTASEPARRFLELVSAAISSGRAHLATLAGGSPVSSGHTWGWQAHETVERLEWHPRGERIGWVDGENVYLDPDNAHGAAQRLGRDTDDPINVSAHIVRKRLKEQRMLASTDDARGTITVRRQCEGALHNVIHLHAAALSPDKKTDKTDTSSAAEMPDWAKPGANVSFSVSFFEPPPTKLTDATPGNNGAGEANVSFVSFSSSRDSAEVERDDIGERALSVEAKKTDRKTDIGNTRCEKTDRTDVPPDALERPAGDVETQEPPPDRDCYVCKARCWRWNGEKWVCGQMAGAA